MVWAWGKEAQFRSDVVPQVGLDAMSQLHPPMTIFSPLRNGSIHYMDRVQNGPSPMVRVPTLDRVPK
jgi:hypothetical protein